MIPDRLPLSRRLRRLVWPVSIETEISEEIAGHLALQTRRFMDAGMSESDARAAAYARFGNLELVRDECRVIRTNMETDMRRSELWAESRMDVQYALRMLRRNPLFALIAIVTMALGIGANTAIFSVLNAVLLQSLPYRFADRTMMIWNNNSLTRIALTSVSPPEYFDLKQGLQRFDAVGAITPQPASLVSDGNEPERVNSYAVTPNFFDLVGVSPMIGRTFGGDDGTPSATRVILLSHALWIRRFGADPNVIGKTVSLGGVVRTVVGVMPPGVRFPDAPLDFLREPADLWAPSTLESLRGTSRGNQILAVIARRKADATPEQAKADLAAMSAQFRVRFPDRYVTESAKGWSMIALPLHDQMVGPVRTALLVISAAVGLILLIACVNVANLLLARAASRHREIAVRVALGAGRGRLVRQMLTESTVLALVGGVFGVALAWIGVRLIVRLDAGELPRLASAGVDGRVLVFSLVTTVVAGLLVGLVPAVQQSSTKVSDALGETTRGSSLGRNGARLRRMLVAAQVAMALLVLVAAGLLARSFVALQRVPVGFSPEHVVAYQVTLPFAKYDSATKVLNFFDQVRARTLEIPGVAEVSGVYPLPMAGDGWSGTFSVDGEPEGPSVPLPHAELAVAMPGYFHAARIPIIAGREFDATDRRDSPPVVVVDEALARKHWPGESAIGKRVNLDLPAGQWATVIGVVGHVHNAGPQAEGEPQLYLPLTQHPQRTVSIVARTNAAPSTILSPIRAVVKSLDPQMPISRFASLENFVSRALAKQRFNTLLLAIFAATALVLSSVGLYGVMSFLVSQRSREIGIRMALGGQIGAIRGMVLREGILIALTGLAVGVVVSLALGKMLSGLLFGVAATDTATYITISALLLAVGCAASYGPARRATRVDPVAALRE